MTDWKESERKHIIQALNRIADNLGRIANGTKVKGRWIHNPSNIEQGEREFIWWKCSNCGQVIFSETEKDRLEFHRFCGRCGAKMEEAEDDRNKNC